MSFQPNSTLGMPGTPLNAPSPWTTTTPTPGPVSTPLQTPLSLETHYFPNTTASTSTTATPTTALKTEPALQSPTFATSNSPLAITTDSPGKDSNSTPDDSASGPTLSPSSYFWNEVVLPGCSDATGTCQCGDGCDCVGCLTHGGHNGVVLDLGDVGGEDSAGGERGVEGGFGDGGVEEFERFVSGQGGRGVGGGGGGGEEAFLGFG
ncbi:hypothetical protein DM02DRAFT_661077 [Periconia macrospinosa]|uniref:Copper-fist domain-containing protein n=1 Tax=Periconia macrospinosa TaxID=97972 RepID=A0A2V1DB61_9PLEO|nr:hypothetical protein DM02DRAFT_661077 [Periconia macrospinosa]